MTYYLGSKADHADDLLKIILAKRKPGQTYVEPFVGGANMICRVPDAGGPRIGADVNPYMIALHKALADGWDPPKSVDEKLYNKMKRNPKNFPPELVGFAGTGCAFGSIWYNTYTEPFRHNLARLNCLKDAPGLKGVAFSHISFDQLDIPPNSLIYCDPPYVGTEGYQDESREKWRAYKFWQWADRKVEEGHTVFVSEYTAPSPEAYPTPPRTPEHTAVMAQFRELQAEINTDTSAVTPAKRARLEELRDRINEYDARRREPCAQLAARWKVLWQKEVSVTVNAIDVDSSKGEKTKTETEKLFHREA